MSYDAIIITEQLLNAFELGTELTEERLNDHSRVRFHNGRWVSDTRKFNV